MNNMKMILLRQESIKGFVFLPSKGYVRKQAEVHDLRARLAMLRHGAARK